MVNLEKDGDDTERVILRGFKYFKRNRRYGKKCPKIDAIIDNLICIYFGVNYSDIHFDKMKKSFVDRLRSTRKCVNLYGYRQKGVNAFII